MFPDVATIIVVAIAGLAMSAIPGPSMLYVLSRSMGQSHTAGLVSSLGLAVGGGVHVLLAVLGITVLINNMPAVMMLIKYCGALYLAYLGITTIFEKPVAPEAVTIYPVKNTPPLNIFLQGVLVEVLNPKTIIFFIAFLPQFIEPNNKFAIYHLLFLGALIPITAIPADVLVAFTGGMLAKKIATSSMAQRVISLVAGGILILLACRLFYMDF